MKTDYKKVEEDLIEWINLDGQDIEADTKAEKLEALFNIFQSEYGWAVTHYGVQRAFAEWLQGLPSAVALPFYNVDIIEKAIEWGGLAKEHTDGEAGKILKNYWSFVAMNYMKLNRKYNKGAK
jgi:hypothetical protein